MEVLELNPLFYAGDIVIYKYLFWKSEVIEADHTYVLARRLSDGEVFRWNPKFLSLLSPDYQ